MWFQCSIYKISELANINATLKRYLEEIVSRVSDKSAAEQIIQTQEARLAEARRMSEFAKHSIVRELTQMEDIPMEAVIDIFSGSN